jgi:hypothetical protein
LAALLINVSAHIIMNASQGSVTLTRINVFHLVPLLLILWDPSMTTVSARLILNAGLMCALVTSVCQAVMPILGMDSMTMDATAHSMKSALPLFV